MSFFQKPPCASRGFYDILSAIRCYGDIAQLVERLNGIEKVRGSTPLISTSMKAASSGLFCYPEGMGLKVMLER